MSQSDPSRKSIEEPDQILTRSRTEIARILTDIFRRGLSVTSPLARSDVLFISRILEVDVETGRFVIDYSQVKAANSVVLAAKTLGLHIDIDRSHVVLLATSPVDIVFAGRHAIRLNFPEYLIRHRQRAQPRFKIPRHMGLKCIVECPGFLPFEGEVVDISLEGQGMMFPDAGIKLEPGTILKNCRIVYRGRSPIIVDLEIRYAESLPQPDHSNSCRVGCRFIGSEDDIADLVKLFSMRLEDIE